MPGRNDMKKMGVYPKNIRMDTTLIVLIAIGSFAFFMLGLLLIIEGSLYGLFFYGVALFLLYIYYQIRNHPYIHTAEEGISLYRYLQHREELIPWKTIQEILFTSNTLELSLSNDKKIKIDLSLVDEDDKEELLSMLNWWKRKQAGTDNP
jgi:hypothetical protein